MDLIISQEAIDAIKKNAYRSTFLSQIIDVVSELPSAEPEVVSCEDCKDFRRWVDTDITFCAFTKSEVCEDDFCSQAERRQND